MMPEQKLISMEMALPLDTIFDYLADQCSTEELIQFVKDLGAAEADPVFSRELFLYFSKCVGDNGTVLTKEAVLEKITRALEE